MRIAAAPSTNVPLARAPENVAAESSRSARATAYIVSPESKTVTQATGTPPKRLVDRRA